MEYRRGALTEWYVNEARGLEQGFTLSAPPARSGKRFGLPTSRIALEMTGALHPKLVSRARSGFARLGGQAVLRYGDLKAWDARDKSWPRGFVWKVTRFDIVIEDAARFIPSLSIPQ